MGYMGSYYSIPKAIFYLLKGENIAFVLQALMLRFEGMHGGAGYSQPRLILVVLM